MSEKEFDITRHEWLDDDFSVEDSREDRINISIKDRDDYWGTEVSTYATLSRKDVIALAKSVNLTAEDLERG